MENFQRLDKTITPPGFPGRSKYLIQTWYIVNATIFRLSPHFMYSWRVLILKLFGAKIGKNVKIRPSANITYPWNVEIDDYTYIGDSVILYSLDKITIGKHASISYRSFLCTGTHDHRNLNFPLITHPINIADEVWIAADSFIHPGVSIGKGTIVSARSTITKNLPSGKIFSGNPCIELGSRKLN